MVKLDFQPSRSMSPRRMRTHKAWNVDTVSFLDTASSFNCPAARSRISPAALLVNVTARIFDALTPCATR